MRESPSHNGNHSALAEGQQPETVKKKRPALPCLKRDWPSRKWEPSDGLRMGRLGKSRLKTAGKQ